MSQFPFTEDSGRILVDVHQVRDLAGIRSFRSAQQSSLYRRHDLIQTMEICPPLLSDH